MSRRLLFILILGAFLGLFASQISPVQGKLMKLGFLGSLGIFCGGSVLLLWRVKLVPFLVLSILVLIAVLLVLPRKPVPVDQLRIDYVDRMLSFESTEYLWGGESRRGIDCSGLPRRALRDALLRYGLQHAHGGALRSYMEQWWFDASARALSDGYRGYTRSLETSGTIRSIDCDALNPGDLAITSNGVHVVVYAGEGKWIQAAPEVGKVITLDGRAEENEWFEAPVDLYRWSILSEP